MYSIILSYTYNDHHRNTILVNSYFDAASKIYNERGRQFVFFTLPPFDRSPHVIREGAVNQERVAGLIRDFNMNLRNQLQTFQRKHPEVGDDICNAANLLIQM